MNIYGRKLQSKIKTVHDTQTNVVDCVETDIETILLFSRMRCNFGLEYIILAIGSMCVINT